MASNYLLVITNHQWLETIISIKSYYVQRNISHFRLHEIPSNSLWIESCGVQLIVFHAVQNSSLCLWVQSKDQNTTNKLNDKDNKNYKEKLKKKWETVSKIYSFSKKMTFMAFHLRSDKDFCWKAHAADT